MLIFYKDVDKSILREGFTVPVSSHGILSSGIGIRLQKGQKMKIQIEIKGDLYDATLTNVQFDEDKYPRGEILQVRYNKMSPLAQRLQMEFPFTQSLLRRLKAETGSSRIEHLPEIEKEFIAVYSTERPGILSFDLITNSEFREGSDALRPLDELVAESILESVDTDSRFVIRTGLMKIRKLNRAISDDLKAAYDYKCQICGKCIGEAYGSKLIHAHHIRYFVESFNNNASNIMIICPNHHSIIHDTNAQFDFEEKTYHYPNGYIEGLRINRHL